MICGASVSAARLALIEVPNLFSGLSGLTPDNYKAACDNG